MAAKAWGAMRRDEDELRNGAVMTLREIAEAMGLSWQRVQQLEARAMGKVRAAMEKKKGDWR